MRNPLYSVSRESYGNHSVGASVSEEGHVGISDPGIEPEPSGRAVVGSYTLWRGRMVYEQARDTQLAKMPLGMGNVLAVVSDVKIGVGPVNTFPSLIDYYTADVVEMSDYEPAPEPRIRWMLLAKRHWVSGEGYRFGFQAQEGDDEWSGEGNMLAFKYRVHDARLGRFLSIDPLAPEYPWNSPYAFSENRVIDGVDLEGAEYLPKSSSKFLFINGVIALQEENFRGVTRSMIRQSGCSIIRRLEFFAPVPAYSIADQGDAIEEGLENETRYYETTPPKLPEKLVSPRQQRRHPSPASASSGNSKMARIGARGFAAIQALEGAVKLVAGFLNYLDWEEANREKPMVDQTLLRYNDAVAQGFVPKEFANDATAASAIMNVILQGEVSNPSGFYKMVVHDPFTNERIELSQNSYEGMIYEIGLAIWNHKLGTKYDAPYSPSTFVEVMKFQGKLDD